MEVGTTGRAAQTGSRSVVPVFLLSYSTGISAEPMGNTLLIKDARRAPYRVVTSIGKQLAWAGHLQAELLRCYG